MHTEHSWSSSAVFFGFSFGTLRSAKSLEQPHQPEQAMCSLCLSADTSTPSPTPVDTCSNETHPNDDGTIGLYWDRLDAQCKPCGCVSWGASECKKTGDWWSPYECTCTKHDGEKHVKGLNCDKCVPPYDGKK